MISLIPYELIVKNGLENQINRKNKITLRAANKISMHCAGSIDLLVTVKATKISKKIHFKVSDDIDEIFISYHDLIRMEIIPPHFPNAICNAIKAEEEKEEKKAFAKVKNMLLKQFEDVLRNNLPREPMKGEEMVIQLKDDVPIKPLKICRSRQVARHIEPGAKALTDELIDTGIIVEENGVTEWVSPGHFVLKPNGKVRLVTDFQQLNKFVKRPVHPFSSSGEIIRSIPHTAKVFCTLDAVSGYFQIKLSEHSSKLTTFLLPWGKFRYCRCPQGCTASSDEWCSRSDVLIAGLAWAAKIVDDILIWADSIEELLKRIAIILSRCREEKITMSRDKFTIGSEVKFAGYIVSGTDGVKPDPEKVQAIKDLPPPENISKLRSFLGMANQLGSFIPDLSQSTMQMRSLLKKETNYVWTPEMQVEFEKAKSILTGPLAVFPFDPTLKTRLLTDASRLHGIGYILVQFDKKEELNQDMKKGHKTRIVQCGSYALSDAQKNYSTIEVEALAIAIALEKCDYFLRGLEHFEIVTDHKPLLGIFKKPITEIANNRLLKFKERSSPYNFDIHWSAGKYNYAADLLSRDPIFGPVEDSPLDEEREIIGVCNAIISTSQDPALANLREKAQTDEEYREIARAFRNNTRATSLDPSHPARAFKSIWDEISTLPGDNDSLIPLLVWNDRIIVPRIARKAILDLLHLPHQGLDKTLKRAKQILFWPNMANDIKTKIASCDSCQKYQPSQRAQPLQMFTKLTTRPMELLGADLFEVKGQQFLALVDAFSGYLHAYPLRKTSSKEIINILLSFFQNFGIPQRILTDNGPQFRSETKSFLLSQGVEHVTSSPYHPQSNGLSEAAVKNAKRIILKCKEEKENIDQALAEFRNTPRINGDGRSPAEIFLGRPIRSLVPQLITSPATVINKVHNPTPLELDPVKNLPGYKLSILLPGDIVLVQNQLEKHKPWDRIAKILGPSKDSTEFSSYDILFIDDNSSSRRNRSQLKLKPEVSTLYPVLPENQETNLNLEENNPEKHECQLQRPPPEMLISDNREANSKATRNYNDQFPELRRSTRISARNQ